MTLYKRDIVGKRALTLVLHSAENADVYWQTVNPQTGKGWQKHRDLQHFEGVLANMKALSAYNRLINVSRKVQQ